MEVSIFWGRRKDVQIVLGDLTGCHRGNGGKLRCSQARPGHQISCCLVALYLLCDILLGRPVHIDFRDCSATHFSISCATLWILPHWNEKSVRENSHLKERTYLQLHQKNWHESQYRLVQKKIPLFEFPALAVAWQTDQPMHSQSANFGNFKLNSLNLAAFFCSTLYVLPISPKAEARELFALGTNANRCDITSYFPLMRI